MTWYVNIKRDYGMGSIAETDSRFSTAGYRMVQEAAFHSCRNTGDYVRMSITAKNREGLTLMMEGMGWSKEGHRSFEETLFEATELSIREGIL